MHPTKAEVRFGNPRLACGILHEAVRRALACGANRSASIAVSDLPRARSGLPELPADLFARPQLGSVSSEAVSSESVPRAEAVYESPAPATRDNPFQALREHTFLQVMNLYLVFEGADGIVVVDQHALHERILYERLRARDAARTPRVQRLLVPEVIELRAADKEWLLAAADSLAAEGFLVSDFGGPSIAVEGIPAVLGKASPQALVETLLAGDSGSSARPSARAAIVERFHSMACRAAVMSGDRLSEEEIRAMLEEAQTLLHPHNCPHGRPTVLTFTGSELERFFRRRV